VIGNTFEEVCHSGRTSFTGRRLVGGRFAWTAEAFGDVDAERFAGDERAPFRTTARGVAGEEAEAVIARTGGRGE